jgi:hypothetical protein
MLYYYNSNAEGDDPKVVDKNWISFYKGIDPSKVSPEDLAAQGFYSYTRPEVPQYNEDIYSISWEFTVEGFNATEIHSLEALPLGQSKGVLIQRVNSQAYSLLSPTDWVVVRQAESGVAIPAEISTWREAVRAEAQLKKESIEDCKTAKRLEAYVSSEDYLTWPTLSTPN